MRQINETLAVLEMERFVVCFLLLCCGVMSAKRNIKADLPPTCDSEIYCQGDLLRVVQMARIRTDSKTFVDMSMVYPPATVLENFDAMMESTNNTPTKSDVDTFVSANFVEGSELTDWTPSDFQSNPPFLEKINDDAVKEFATNIVALWEKLGRTVSQDVLDNLDKHSLIYVPNGFIIPGGRFREFYYWDTYWIMEGLLISDMSQTVRGMLENFLAMVEKFGFVPNGGRVYYLNRSQPPLLTKMVWNYIEKTDDVEWLKIHIDTLAKELQFWLDNRLSLIRKDDEIYFVCTYDTKSLGPRPESYYEDVMTASIFPLETDQQNLFNELKGAAQSGWDFSTRWIFDETGDSNASISFTHTSRVVPVDLNAILYGAFHDISKLYEKLGQVENQIYWEGPAAFFLDSITGVLWDPQEEIWHDYDIVLKTPRRFFAASNLTPLWTKAFKYSGDGDKQEFGAKAVKYLESNQIPSYLGGVPATTIRSNEQWDMPNAWPPLQSIIVQGLNDTGHPAAVQMAAAFAKNWVTANMLGFENSEQMFEKYDAETPGAYGGGGEYTVQSGFGWTNGVVLDFIHRYYSDVEN